MSALDQLLKTHVTAGMASAGFERVGRVYRAVAESGDHAFVWCTESKARATTFVVTASIMITTYSDFLQRDEPDPGPITPSALYNSLVLDVPAPSDVADAEPTQLWSFDTDTRSACGAALATLLVTDLAPWLLARLDRDALAEEIDNPTRSWRGAPTGRATQAVMALLDDGPLTVLRRLLPKIDDVTPGRSLTAWINARLESRDHDGAS